MLCWYSPSTRHNDQRHEDDRRRSLQPFSSSLLSTYKRDFINLNPLRLPSGVRSSSVRSGVRSSIRSGTVTPPFGQHMALHVNWPVFNPHFYTSSNSTYGSFLSSLFSSSSPVSLQQSALQQLSLKGAAEGQDTGPLTAAAEGLGPLLGLGERGQLLYVFREAEGDSEQSDKEAEAALSDQRPLEEGVIVVSSHVGGACCEGFLESVYRGAGLEHLLQTPQDASHITCAEWESSPQWRPYREALAATGTQLQRPTHGEVWASADCLSAPAPRPAVTEPKATPAAPPKATPRAPPSATPLLYSYINTYICDWARP